MNLCFDEFEVPSSTYRLQLSADFPISRATKILPFLKEFGIEAVYCSPYYKAFTSHGYDVTDPSMFNPLLGSMQEFKHFFAELKRLSLMHIADVVPNHMGIKGGQNFWWQDVLENGPYSEFADYFDVNFSPEKRELQDRVLLPILGVHYRETLLQQEVQLAYSEGKFYLNYADYLLPAAPHSYAMILEHGLNELKKSFSENDPVWIDYLNLIELYHFFPANTQERSVRKKAAQKRLISLFKSSSKIKKHILSRVEQFNGRKNRPNSFALLDQFLEMQFYRLTFWRAASHEINYRRFFNITDLVAIRIEEEKVLENHHKWLFELVRKNYIQGLRIDHPDGLYDPVRYFDGLKQRAPIFTVIEKVLEWKEELPENWNIEGTVGYEYLNVLNGIFVQEKNQEAMTVIYEEFVGRKMEFDEILYHSKKHFTDYEMVSEVESLGLKLDRLSDPNWEYRDFTKQDLTKALAEVIACFPVYRSYVAPHGPVSKRDHHYIQTAIEKAKVKNRELDVSIFEFLEKILLVKIKMRPDEEAAYRDFTLRFQQLSSAMMAKGLEDTSFYVYNRLLSLNEVGGVPSRFGHSVGSFHAQLHEKKEKWPFGMLATSTHDTKRSEDVRMRLNVLSEIPERWHLEVKKWSLINRKYKKKSVSANTEYFIYQTLLGVWPSHHMKKEEHAVFCQRIWEVILKSIREARQETSWQLVNSPYEEEVRFFCFSILSLYGQSNKFLRTFLKFHKIIDRYGGWNSLSMVGLKIASPGVVDIYQGNEILDYKLVDPDNRTLVNFDMRQKMLEELKSVTIQQLFASHELAKAKFLIQTKALHFRRQHKDLFLNGEYIPLKTKGMRKEHVIAFLRKKEKKVLIVLAARFYSHLAAAEWDTPLGKHAWGNTEVVLPQEMRESLFTELFTEKKIFIRGALRLASVFESLPLSYLYYTDEKL